LSHPQNGHIQQWLSHLLDGSGRADNFPEPGGFWRLLDAINSGSEPPEAWLTGVQRDSSLFPLLNAVDWLSQPKR